MTLPASPHLPTPNSAPNSAPNPVPRPPQALVEALPPGKLVLFPGILWTCVGLLHTPHVQIYQQALQLLTRVLANLRWGAGRPGQGGWAVHVHGLSAVLGSCWLMCWAAPAGARGVMV
jgi:hypothetical protein